MEETCSLIYQPPEIRIERVSAVEVYLLSGTSRYKRICGSTATYSGGVCIYEAGLRTNHLGKGFCHLHETNQSNAAWNLILRNEVDPETKPLLQYLQAAGGLSDSQLSDLTGEIQMLYSLIATVQHNKSILLPSDMDLIRKILGDLVKAKEVKSKIEKEVKFEVEGIKSFVNQVFSVIVAQLDAATARRVMNMIMEKVIMPLEATDKLSGDVKELHAAVGHHKARTCKDKEVPATFTSESSL